MIFFGISIAAFIFYEFLLIGSAVPMSSIENLKSDTLSRRLILFPDFCKINENAR